jgi:cell division protein FtsI/penicillin-binding protein 2
MAIPWKNIITWIKNNKISFIQRIFIVLFVVAIVRIVTLKDKSKPFNKKMFHNSKSVIYDRNGEFLTTLKNFNYLIIDIQLYQQSSMELRQKIYNFFTPYNFHLKEITFEKWDKKIMESGGKFVEIKLKVKNQLPAIEDFIIDHNGSIKLMTLKKKIDRYLCYPNSLAYIIGMAIQEGHSFSSITKFLNQQDQEISKIQLTIDIRIQESLYAWAKKLTVLFAPKSIWFCVIDLETREIISSVSTPSFDPNANKIFIDFSNTDRIFNYRYEMGSICKIFSYLFYLSDYSGLNYNMNDMVNVPSVLKIGRFEVKDVTKFAPKEYFYQAFVLSSNTVFGGIMAQLHKPEKYFEFLKLLGIKDTIDIDGVFKEKPMYLKGLNFAQSVTLAYGYGVLFSPIRFSYMMANAITGEKKPLHIIKNMKNHYNESIFQRKEFSQTILGQSVTSQLHKTLEILGLRHQPYYKNKVNAAYKTGTAKVLQNGHYLNNRINGTMMGFYPANKPRFLIFWCVEDPSLGPRKVSHFYTRSRMGDIMDDIKPYLDELLEKN